MTNFETKFPKNKRWVVYEDGSTALVSGGLGICGRIIKETIELDDLSDKEFGELEELLPNLEIKKTKRGVTIKDLKR